MAMSSVVSQAGVAARVPGGFGFFAAGKILLPGARAAAARGCRRVRCVGTLPRSPRGLPRPPRAETESLYPRQSEASFVLREGSLKRREKNVARACGGRAPQLGGDGCGAGGAWVAVLRLCPASRRGAVRDGVARTRTPSTLPRHTQTYARRRRAPPRPVKDKDGRPPLLPRARTKATLAVGRGRAGRRRSRPSSVSPLRTPQAPARRRSPDATTQASSPSEAVFAAKLQAHGPLVKGARDARRVGFLGSRVSQASRRTTSALRQRPPRAARAPFSKDAPVRGEVRRAPLGGPVGFSSALFIHRLEPPLPCFPFDLQRLGAPAVVPGIQLERLADGLLPGALRGFGPAFRVLRGRPPPSELRSTRTEPASAAKARRFSAVSRRSKAQPSAWNSSVESQEFLSGWNRSALFL